MVRLWDQDPDPQEGQKHAEQSFEIALHRESAERLAVQLQARRRAGATILHRCPCGGIVCNGLFDSKVTLYEIAPPRRRVLDHRLVAYHDTLDTGHGTLLY
jgi:hypothetical protein